MRKRILALGAVAVLILTAASVALAEASVIVTSTDLEAADQETKFTATNLTADAIQIEVGALDQAACGPTFHPDKLLPKSGAAAIPTEVTVTLTGCDLEDDLALPVLFAGSETKFTITEESEPTVDSGLLGHWFQHAAIWAGAVIGFAVLLSEKTSTGTIQQTIARALFSMARWLDPNPGGDGTSSSSQQAASTGDGLGFRKLYGIEPGWKFKDSWASNVTIVSSGLALFVASSDTMKALLGSSAEQRLGTIVVGSAIAAALVAISPIAALISREVGGEGKHVTQWGLALGAFLTLTGTIGEIFLLRSEGQNLTEGWISAGIGIAGMIGVAAVSLYGVASLARLLALTEEPDKKPAEAEAAAKVIAWTIHVSRLPLGELDDTARSALKADVHQTAGELQTALEALIELRGDATPSTAPRASSL